MKRFAVYGKGGSGTEERCRLYMTMEFQELTLVKVKSPKKLKGFDQQEIQGGGEGDDEQPRQGDAGELPGGADAQPIRQVVVH